ncbi:MAG: sulfate transporter CysZ [Gammaproteobacteria bacterium]|nr:MAG: sulfate transporter CysZ [Gammaproteobacteria bacterium]
MISNPLTGASYFINGLSLINASGIRRYVLIPLLINILVFSAGLWFAISRFEIFITWALSDLPGWLSWLEWILWPLFALTFYGLVFFGFSIVANIIAAPFNGPLAAAVERHLSGGQNINRNKKFIDEIKDSIGNEFVKLKYSLYLMMPLAFLSLLSFAFALISPLVAVLWMVYTVWVLTLEYADFPMANHAMSFPVIREKLASKRVLSLGFGSLVLLATMIPFVNFLVMPAAVAGATKMYLNEFKN